MERIKLEPIFDENISIKQEIDLDDMMNYYANEYNIAAQETEIETKPTILLPEMKKEPEAQTNINMLPNILENPVHQSKNSSQPPPKPRLTTNVVDVKKGQVKKEEPVTSIKPSYKDDRVQHLECYITYENMPGRPRRSRSARSSGSDAGPYGHGGWRRGHRSSSQGQYQQNNGGPWNNSGQFVQHYGAWFTNYQQVGQNYGAYSQYHCPGCNCFQQVQQNCCNWNDPRSRPY